MTPETEDFLELVRHAEGPSSDDEQRVLRALQASIAAGAAPTVVVSASRSESWFAQSGAALKGTVATLGVVAVGTALALSVDGAATARVPGASPSAAPRAAAIEAPAAMRATPAVSAGASASAEPPARPAPAHEARPSKPAKVPSVPGVSSLREELAILETAQQALKNGDGEAALRELDRPVTKDGQLLPERQAARILALCAVGREAEARAAIDRFDRDHPGSAHREAIGRGCTNLQRIGEP